VVAVLLLPRKVLVVCL